MKKLTLLVFALALFANVSMAQNKERVNAYNYNKNAQSYIETAEQLMVQKRTEKAAKEMNNAKWSIGAIAYMTGFAYAMCLVVYQLGTLINGGAFGIGTIAAILTLGAFLFLLFRKNKNKN